MHAHHFDYDIGDHVANFLFYRIEELAKPYPLVLIHVQIIYE